MNVVLYNMAITNLQIIRMILTMMMISGLVVGTPSSVSSGLGLNPS